MSDPFNGGEGRIIYSGSVPMNEWLNIVFHLHNRVTILISSHTGEFLVLLRCSRVSLGVISAEFRITTIAAEYVSSCHARPFLS